MKHRFGIVSDGSCDLPDEITAEYNISIVHFLVSFDDNTYKKEGVEISLDDFYKRMLTDPDTFPKTAAPSPKDFLREFTKYAAAGQDILCICISTKLSSAMQSAKIAKDMLHDKYPDVKIYVMDCLCATLMQSAFVLEACSLRDKGYTLEQAVPVLKELRSTARIFFTVGNLDYIEHGGRIGKMTSLAGSLLNIKPLITLQDGEIHSSGIRRGRRRSVDGLVDLLVAYLKENNCTPADCRILVGYGSNYEEAFRLRELTDERLHDEWGISTGIPICRIGATIGVHAGPTSIGYGVVRHINPEIMPTV